MIRCDVLAATDMRKIVVPAKAKGLLIPIVFGFFAAGCVDLNKPATLETCAKSTTSACVNQKDDAATKDSAAEADASSGSDAGADTPVAAPDAQLLGDSATADASRADTLASPPDGNPDAGVDATATADSAPSDARPTLDIPGDVLSGSDLGADGTQTSADTHTALPDAGEPGADDASDVGSSTADTTAATGDAAQAGDAVPAGNDAAPPSDAAPDSASDTGDGGPDVGSPTDAGSSEVTFKSGRAVGTVMSGYGWVTLGSADTVTSPTCGATNAPITNADPCSANTVWDNPAALCVTGSLPALSQSPTAQEYAANWGIQVGANASEPPAPIGVGFRTITVNATGVPTADVRIEIHRHGDGADATYCTPFASGVALALTSFNTQCWDNSGVKLTDADILTIDKVGMQVSPGSAPISLTNLCLESIVFGN